MVKLNKFINYIAERSNEDLDDGLMFKKCGRREEMDVSPTMDIKQSRNSRGNTYRQPLRIRQSEYRRSNLHYSFTPESLYEESLHTEVIPPSKVMTTVPQKKKRSSMDFISTITKKLLPIKRTNSFRRYGDMSKQKPIKFLNININKNVNNIPMQVIETLYTISFTKHTYYIQRSLRRSTMIVNLITRFRSTYEELREIDTPKLKRRISFKKRNANPKKRGEQPKEGSLIDLREQKLAKYYQTYGINYPYYQNVVTPVVVPSIPSMVTIPNMVPTMVTDITASVPLTPVHPPRRRKRIPKKPLLDFSDCDSLPSVPATAIPLTAAGSKISHYVNGHKESERRKLKPIKNIDKELCLIFNKEYMPDDQKEEEEEEEEKVTEEETSPKSSQSSLPTTTPVFSKQPSVHVNPTHPIESLLPCTPYSEVYDSSDDESSSESSDEEELIEGLENISIFTEEPKPLEENEQEQKAVSKTIPSPSSATTLFMPDIESTENGKKDRKRISECTLCNEAEDKQLESASVKSDSSDKTLEDEEMQNGMESSFIVVDKNGQKIDFHIGDDEEEDEESDDEEEEKEKEKSSYLLDMNKEEKKNDMDKSFSLTNSFLLNDNSKESIIPEYMSNFLLNKSSIFSTDDENDLFNNYMQILNESIINEKSFSLDLNLYEDSKDTNNKDNKPLNRVDSGVEVDCMENFSYLMETQCQI